MAHTVSVVIQRYGDDILGGAESHARHVAERLAATYDVEILTTCAHDYNTWANHYPPGVSQVNGLPVRRFPVAHPRPANFRQYSEAMYNRAHTLAEEMAWVRAQGPYAPALLDHLKQQRETRDVFIFFTYLYYPTAMGVKVVGDKAVLVPTTHNEGPFYFDFYRGVFHAPRAILYNTEEERQFVQRRLNNGYIPNAVVGVGVDVPPAPQPGRFRHKLGLDGRPYFLYLGRITDHKGCDELVRFYEVYQRAYPREAALVLVGKGEMPLPNLPGLVYGGYVDDTERFDALAGALAIVVPSRYESLSMIALEAWTLGKPVVCTAYSDVVRGMCQRGNSGLYYYDAAEFSEILHLLATDESVTARLGQQGQAFVQATYTWPRVIATYRQHIDAIIEDPWG